MMLDTAHLNPRFKVEYEGYWRQYCGVAGKFVFQLRTLTQPYTAFQGPKKYVPGATVTINMSALTDNAQDWQHHIAQSSVVCAIPGNSTQTLVYSVEMLGYDAVTGDCELELTATAASYMRLATAIREKTETDKTLKSGIMTYILHFGTAGVIKSDVSFAWRALSTCKKRQLLPPGEYTLVVRQDTDEV
jgi:hypothetical protein